MARDKTSICYLSVKREQDAMAEKDERTGLYTNFTDFHE